MLSEGGGRGGGTARPWEMTLYSVPLLICCSPTLPAFLETPSDRTVLHCEALSYPTRFCPGVSCPVLSNVSRRGGFSRRFAYGDLKSYHNENGICFFFFFYHKHTLQFSAGSVIILTGGKNHDGVQS